MSEIEKMNRKQLASQVEEELMRYIQQESVLIGEKIPNEFELAEKFGVGRSTVRETVKSLVTKGVLEVRRGSGTYVVSKSTIEEDPLGLSKFTDKYKLGLELFEVRLMLEPEIAALASDYATPEEKEELKRLCDEVEQIYRAGKNHTKKDIEFHTCIARCSRNRVVEMLQPIMQTAIVTFVNLTHRSLMEETIETHRWPAEVFYYAGGVPAIMEEIKAHLHLDVMTVTGKTLGENLKEVVMGLPGNSCISRSPLSGDFHRDAPSLD